MKRALVTASAVLALSACADPLTKQGQATPEFYAKNVKGYGETVAGLPPEKVLAWNLVVVGDTARWRECTSLDVCGNVERSRPASDLLGVERLEATEIDGGRTEVLRLSLSPRPGYIVPTAKPARSRL